MNYDVLGQKPMRIMWSQRDLVLRKPTTSSIISWLATCYFLLLVILGLQVSNLTEAKVLGFKDPNTHTIYRLESPSAYEIIVSRVDRDELHRIQRLPFKSAPLVDFDINCQPAHCYLVAVTNKTSQNVELFSWDRVQFDLKARRDSFARPHSVKLFRIYSGFYIAVAQDQLHLFSNRPDLNEQPKFIGCALLKFIKGHEEGLKYHQFIKLPFNPNYVKYLTSINPNNITLSPSQPSSNHYLIFSQDQELLLPGSSKAYSFIWSPLNDLFWPYKMPNGVEAVQQPGSQRWTLIFPNEVSALRPQNLTAQSVESCFNQLQRLLHDRQLQAKRLVESSGSIWRPSQAQNAMSLTDISAQVIVHGNVYVKGSVIESPQISLIASNRPAPIETHQLLATVNTHSPTLVDNKLKQALYRLKVVREKLSRAVSTNVEPNFGYTFSSRIRFVAPIRANTVIFGGHGVANSNVRLNGLPFNHLEHELVSLREGQEIKAAVVFTGNVTADLLEVQGLINGAYYLRDAVDIFSSNIQMIGGNSNRSPNQSALFFRSVNTTELSLKPNVTLNEIQLRDLITRDSGPQYVHGMKSFKNLSMAQLDLASSNVILNGVNMSHIALNAVRLNDPSGLQRIDGNYVTFTKPVRVNKLLISSLINRHINISSLIYDSVKTDDVGQQQISGHKRFLQGLNIFHLTTDGSINGIQMNQVFNLNAQPLDYGRYGPNQTASSTPIVGTFQFHSIAIFNGNLTAQSINGIDVARRAIRRIPKEAIPPGTNISQPQLVRGKKIFLRPLRVTNKLDLLDQRQYQLMNLNRPLNEPLVNGLDIRQINNAIQRQMENPRPKMIDTLEIDGHLSLKTFYNQSRLHTLGNYGECPIHVIRSKVILNGLDDQVIDIPVRLQTLKAKSIHFGPGALNNMNFPNDFVLRSETRMAPDTIEPVFGHKSFDQLIIAPAISMMNRNLDYGSTIYGPPNRGTHLPRARQSIQFGPRASVNNISYNEMQTFIGYERRKSPTGEISINTLNVHGNIYSRRINGYYWPDDILLKSFGSNQAPPISPSQHRRIYSPLVFLNSTDLIIRNQLVLRGPIQLAGRLNGINLTQFVRQSVTYGDKDLLSTVRPISNKVFAGGLTVIGETLSQGLIDGINFDEMKARVVTIVPKIPDQKIQIYSQKGFLSDVVFNGPLYMNFLNDIRLDYLLPRIKLPYDNIIPVLGRKSIAGTVEVNKNLVVQGLINGIDFLNLEAKAITLGPTDNLKINKTLTIEGNAYMDNLLMDEKRGIIDGVKLTSLIPIGSNQNSHRPVAIQYDSRRPTRSVRAVPPETGDLLERQLYALRKQFINLDLFGVIDNSNLIVGFIESPSNNIASYILPDQNEPHHENTIYRNSFHLLDQYDFPFKLTVYHLSVGVSVNASSNSETGVYYSLTSSEQYRLSVLPIESPNSAKFLNVANHTLFLLVSQDYTITTGNKDGAQCPRYRRSTVPSLAELCDINRDYMDSVLGGLHVYLFHALQNSSDLRKSYFDLYQTIDLPPIDSFEGFDYGGSTYALAVSRYAQKVYLLVLRGYSGFQIVSYVHTPMVEYVRVIHDQSFKPALIVYQQNGIHRLLRSVEI